MRQKPTWRQYLLQIAVGLPVVIWLGLQVAPYYGENLFVISQGLNAAMQHPFQFTLCANSGKSVLTLCAIYIFALLAYFSTKRNTRYGEEHGSARWGDPVAVCRKLRDKEFRNNRILSQNVRIGYDFYRHQRNLNACVVGGSGSKKSRSHVIPNVMQCECSKIILDPMGEILAGTGNLLLEEGYEVRVLDLIEMEKSNHYNPFVYIRNENDLQTMVTFLFAATNPGDSKGQDPFWEQSAQMLLMALCFYLWLEAPPEEQNFAMVSELLRCCAGDDTGDEDDMGSSITDTLFDALEKRDPNHIALRYYRQYRSGAGKTLRSIQIILATRLEKFNLSSVAALTATDDLDLRSIGEKKVTLFARISDTDKSYNFLVAMLYTQLFQQLAEVADLKYHGKLPVHVHFLMDEFANVALPKDFETYLSTMRKRNISVSIVLQNIAQLKGLFKDNKWESILGNCDEFVFLGGNEQSTHEYISKQLGKETIWQRSESMNRGRNGSSGRSDQTSGRELLLPDEVRSLDNDYAILLIRGFPPLLDRKYELSTHPNYKRTAFGGAAPYEHGPKEIPETTPSTTAPKENPTTPEEPEVIALTEAELDDQF